MAETLTSRKLTETDLITNLEKINSRIANTILKLEGYALKKIEKSNWK